MKVYRQHRCTARHRTHTTAAECMVPSAAWVSGRGPYAVIAWCAVTTITLHMSTEAAQHAMDTINATGCGGRCSRRHDLVYIDLAALRSNKC